jgi:hypothetical protein
MKEAKMLFAVENSSLPRTSLNTGFNCNKHA